MSSLPASRSETRQRAARAGTDHGGLERFVFGVLLGLGLPTHVTCVLELKVATVALPQEGGDERKLLGGLWIVT